MPNKGKNKRRRKNNKRMELPREEKFFDQTFFNAFTPALNSGTIYAASILDIEEGTRPSQRVGRKIHVTGIGLKMFSDIPSDNDPVSAADVLRVVVYQDKQCNGLVANINDIYAEIDPGSSTSILSFRNLLHVNRFKILQDKLYHIEAKGAISAGATPIFQPAMLWNEWMNVSMPILYEGALADIANITENNVGILVFAGRQSANLTISVRVRYLDI